MNRPAESGDSQLIGPEPLIVENLLARIEAAPADASIQDIAAEVVAEQLDDPIDLLALHEALRAPIVAQQLRRMLWQVIEVNLSQYATQLQAAEVLEPWGLVARDVEYSDRKETPSDCLYRNMYAVRDGKTVSEVFRQVIRETKISFDEVLALFLRPDILPALTNSLLVAARERIDALYIEQFATDPNKKRLVVFAREAGGEDLSYSAKLLTAYKIPIGESLSLVSGKIRRDPTKQTRDLAEMIAADREQFMINLQQDIIQWLEHAGNHVSMHDLVAQFAEEGFIHDGLGVDEIARLFESPIVESILDDSVTQMARGILKLDGDNFESDFEDGKGAIRQTDRDAIIAGKMLVSDVLGQYKYLGRHAAESLPARAQFTQLLIKAAQYKVKDTYKLLLLKEFRQDATSNTPTIKNLGSRMSQSIASGQVAENVVFGAVDDITRAGIQFNDACDIVSRALKLVGHRYSPDRVMRATYKAHGNHLQAEAEHHSALLQNSGTSHSRSAHQQYAPTPEAPDSM